MIPQSGRSAGEGIGYLLQYSWASLVTHMVKHLTFFQLLYIDSLFNLDYYPIRASLVAQQVKNPPALQETPVQFPGQEDPQEKG